MQTCPNCGRVAQANAKVCPNCGAALTGDVWPPPVPGQPIPAPPEGRLLTGSRRGDIALGIVTSLLSCLFFAIGLIAIPIVYALTTRKYPVFARALGWTYIGVLCALAGAFCLCVVGMSTYGK